MEERIEAKREFFAAANSGKGFVSFYSRVFGDKSIKRRYLIKGGPGTGKSTFMKDLAKRALEGGLDVEYFRCSSDPSSLDAVIIAGRVAVIDATSPHCVEGECVGARDEIINLGAFWDSCALGERFEEIKRISEAKKGCYSRAYRFLDAAMQVDEVSREIGSGLADREKMKKAVKRLMRTIPNGDGFELSPKLCDSMGMSGRVRLEGYENSADKVYVIKDEYKIGSIFLAMLIDEARNKGCVVNVSYCPITPDYPDALLFQNDGIAFVVDDCKKKFEKESIYTNMKRFIKKSGVSREIKNEYKNCLSLFEGLVQAAEYELGMAGREHFKLEEIYKGNMDFASQGDFLNRVAEGIIEITKVLKYGSC